VPQDHPAREASDIYYVKEPQSGDISQHTKALEHVKETHENGWKTGSQAGDTNIRSKPPNAFFYADTAHA
jgi:phenylalanyl-tRNA synthetase alpha subunit